MHLGYEQHDRAEEPQHERDAEEVRYAKHAHLGDGGLEENQEECQRRKLGRIGAESDGVREGAIARNGSFPTE